MEILSAVFWILLGGALLILGGEFMVRGASRLALRFRVSPLIIGLTIVAVCTSAPELAISLSGCFKANGSPDLAIGNAVGSGICNILLILGVASLICPLTISSNLIRREFPLMIGSSTLLWFVALLFKKAEGGNLLPQWVGGIFVLMLIVYMIWTVREARRAANQKYVKEFEQTLAERIRSGSQTSGSDTDTPSRVEQTEQKKEVSTAENVTGEQTGFLNLLFLTGMLLVGLGMLIIGSDWVINGSVTIATCFHVSKLVIGLTILAIGTSLPELTVSIVAAFRNQADITIGNVVGSNIFNILGVLGVTAVFVPGGIPVSMPAISIDIPIMIGSCIIGYIFCATGLRLDRREGAVLLLFYAVYIGYRILSGTGMEVPPEF